MFARLKVSTTATTFIRNFPKIAPWSESSKVYWRRSWSLPSKKLRIFACFPRKFAYWLCFLFATFCFQLFQTLIEITFSPLSYYSIAKAFLLILLEKTRRELENPCSEWNNHKQHTVIKWINYQGKFSP